VVAGAVTTSAAQSALGELLSGLSSRHTHTVAPPWEGLKAPVEQVASRPKKQTGLALALEAPSPLHTDAPAYRMLVTLLSSSSGRMRAELRNRQSLAYSLGAGDNGTSQHNLLVLSMACDTSKEMAARAGLLHVLEGLVLHPPSQEELDRSRQLLLGRRATSLQTLSARTGSLAHALARGMTPHFYDQFEERLNAVTLEQLQAVAARWCRPERYALGVARGEGG
jgi:zinc protease